VTGKDLRAALDAVLAGKTTSQFQAPSMGCNIKWKAGTHRGILNSLEPLTRGTVPGALASRRPRGIAAHYSTGPARRQRSQEVICRVTNPVRPCPIGGGTPFEKSMSAGKNQNEVEGDHSRGAAPKILEQLVHQAEQAGASDIHLQMRGKAAEVSFRSTASLFPAPNSPPTWRSALLAALNFSRG